VIALQRPRAVRPRLLIPSRGTSSNRHDVNHPEFLAVVDQCRTEQGALSVVSRVRAALFGDLPLPLPDDVRAANHAAGHLVKSLQRWSNAVRIDDAVHAVLSAVDAITPPDKRLEAARELLHAMLLATGERAAEQRRAGAPPDSTAQLEVPVDDGAQPSSR
jgi:hypothetical protein